MKQNSSGDIIFQIDADEFLKKSQNLKLLKENIIGILYNKENSLISPNIIDINGSTYKTIPRIFNNIPNLSYFGNVHEELRSTDGLSLDNINIDIIVYHDGYTVDKIISKSKLERNISLLNKMIEKEPNNPRWSYFLIRELYYIGTNRKIIIDKIYNFLNKETGNGNFMFIHIILGLCYGELNNYKKSQEISIYLRNNNNIIDSLFLEIMQIQSFIKSKSSELNIIIKQLCNMENFNSQINSNGDHVKVQLFKLLFSLSRYDEAFSILEEINYYIRKESIIPELKYIKEYIDKILNENYNEEVYI